MPTTRKKKVSSALGAGLTGAAAGASIGSIFPGLGTLVGGVGGGLVGLLSGYLGTEPTEQSVVKALNKLSKKQIKDLESKIKTEQKAILRSEKSIEKDLRKKNPKADNKTIEKLKQDKLNALNPSKDKISKYEKELSDIQKKLVTQDQVARGEVGNSPTNSSDQSQQSVLDRIWNGDNNGIAANLTPQKTQAQSDILKHALGKLKNEQAYDFGPIEKLSMQNFQQNIAPDILEGLTGGAAYAALGRAGADLSTKLAAFRQEHNMEQQKMDRDLFRYGLAQLESGDTTTNKGLKQRLEESFSNPENLKNFGTQLMDMYNTWSSNRSQNKGMPNQQSAQQIDNQFMSQKNQSSNASAQQPQQKLSAQQLTDVGNQLKFNPGNYNQNMDINNILSNTNYLPKSKSFNALRGL